VYYVIKIGGLPCIVYGWTVIAGETDWKVIAIDITDSLANDLNGMHLMAVPVACSDTLNMNLIEVT